MEKLGIVFHLVPSLTTFDMAKYTQGTTLGKQSSRHQFKRAPFNCKVVNHRVVKKIESGRRHGKSNGRFCGAGVLCELREAGLF